MITMLDAKQYFGKHVLGHCMGNPPHWLTEGRNDQLVPFPQLDSEMAFLGQVLQYSHSQRLSHYQWTHQVENCWCDK